MNSKFLQHATHTVWLTNHLRVKTHKARKLWYGPLQVMEKFNADEWPEPVWERKHDIWYVEPGVYTCGAHRDCPVSELWGVLVERMLKHWDECQYWNTTRCWVTPDGQVILDPEIVIK